MHDDYVITKIPEKYHEEQKEQKSINGCEKAIRWLVKKHPAMFADKRWDKYRESKQEEPDDDIPF